MKDPEVIQALLSLEKKNGVLRAEDVVEEARSPDSCLHDRFTWDESEAARRWRLEEGRNLIQSVAVYREIDGKQQPVRIFESLTTDRKEEGGGYRSLDNIMAVPVYTNQLLADALSDLQHFQRKYAQYKFLAHFKPLRRVFKEMEKLEKKQVKSEKPDSPAKGIIGENMA